MKALKIINNLKKIGLIDDYAIGGRFAVSQHIGPVLTYDLDIFILIDTTEDYEALYEFLVSKGYKMANTHIIIADIPVHFLPSYIAPLAAEAIKKAKRVRVNNVSTKVLTKEYLIATMLMSFRAKDKAILPDILESANIKLVADLARRFSNEKAPLYKRLRKVLGSIQ